MERRKPVEPVSGMADDITRRERAIRSLAVAAFFAVLLGTTILSFALLSVEEHRETVTIEPGSHYTVHIGMYGLGIVQYSAIQTGGPQIYLLVMDKPNYHKFVEGEDYDYTGYETIGYGGRGHAMSAGFIWEFYFVIVNEEGAPATVDFEIGSVCYFSLLMAVPVLAAVAAGAYAVNRFFISPLSPEEALISLQVGMTERRKGLLAIAGLIIMTAAIMWILGLVIPSGTAYLLFGSAFYRLYIGLLAASAAVYILRFRLATVPGKPKNVLADLAHRLRISRLRVSEKTGLVSVQISSIAAIRIRARPIAEGTQIMYRADAAPGGWAMVTFLLLFYYFSLFSLAISLYILYRTVDFAERRVLPRLSQLPIGEAEAAGPSTHAMLIDSLSEARRLSAESYEAARSNYQDTIIVLVTVAFTASALLALFTGIYILDDFADRTRGLISFGVGMAIGVSSSLVSWRLLAAKSRLRIENPRLWSARLEVALHRETESRMPLDTEPSSFELAADAYKHLPEWLRVRRRAGMYREPGYWLLIFFFLCWTLFMVLAGAFDLAAGNLLDGAVFLAISASFAALAALFYFRWRRRKEEEDARVSAEWAERFNTMKAEMEKYLGSV